MNNSKIVATDGSQYSLVANIYTSFLFDWYSQFPINLLQKLEILNFYAAYTINLQ